MKKISLITMSQGNPQALRRTLESFRDVVDEVVYGDLIIFPEDRKAIREMEDEFKMKIVRFPFNYIFQQGFSSALNLMAAQTKNDWVLYMNCSEVIDDEHRILELMDHFDRYGFNCYPFDHATDPHTWYRLYKKSELSWSGLIHEDLLGNRIAASHYIFRMADTEKDLVDPFKAKVMNDVKEIVYFNQYVRLVEFPEMVGATSPGWIEWAATQYLGMKERLYKKDKRYIAFETGDLEMYMKDVYENKEFAKEKFESSTTIEYQGDPKFLGK